MPGGISGELERIRRLLGRMRMKRGEGASSTGLAIGSGDLVTEKRNGSGASTIIGLDDRVDEEDEEGEEEYEEELDVDNEEGNRHGLMEGITGSKSRKDRLASTSPLFACGGGISQASPATPKVLQTC